MLALACAAVAALVPMGRPQLAAPLRGRVVALDVVAADDETASRLWACAGKPLLRIGKAGATPSHANGLADLCSAAPTVCVRITGSATDASLAQLVQLAPSAPLAAGPGRCPVLLSTRRPRKGGVEALFSQQARADEVCGAKFHAALVEQQLVEESEAQKWAVERAATAAKVALKASTVGRKRPRGMIAKAARVPKPAAMMAKGYATADELHAAVRSYLAEMPEGAADDPALPSPLNYNELNYHGRSDLVEGCMAFGGYLKVSNELGVPVRIGVERPAGETKPAADAAKKAVNLFNLFGNSG